MDRDMAYSLKHKMTIFEACITHFPHRYPKGGLIFHRLNYQLLFDQRKDLGDDRNQVYILSMIGRYNNKTV